MMRVDSRTYEVNFAITAGLLARLSSAMKDAAIDHDGDDPICLLKEHAPPVGNQWVASFVDHKTAGGFSSSNISTFGSFQRVENLRVSYCSDVRWLQDDAEAKMPIIPYAEAALRSRLAPITAPGDISLGARASILAVIESCTLMTRFSVRTARPDLCMDIAVCDIVGYLARRARLNDAVLMYALRQMASDQHGVHVFECLPCPKYPPPTSLLEARTLLFPVNYDRAHWCLVCVKLDAGTFVEVAFYDPLQGVYEDSLRESWREICLPLITRWCGRDSIVVRPDLETRVGRSVRLKAQHDQVSCGVYCLAIAYDYISESMYFQLAGELGASAACQLRIRVMWRIFCNSYRREAHHDEEEAARILEIFRNSNHAGTSTARVSGGTLFTS
jgi:hypothetical protein